WGQIKVRFETGAAVVHIFVMTLGYSRRAYVEGFEHERLASLLTAHEHAFEGEHGVRSRSVTFVSS
ncbi:MAG: hypothetical protein KDH16_05885, partial [Rhodocyclaceae bacterium]|nr:hypothetical protein [Rhodocyclaceae bacterium]